ncbi:MAG TPA: hypothetical protein VFY84_01630 [Jiangellales bacterium]|nr:hypothetical protein [Jiangellales bacterium]
MDDRTECVELADLLAEVATGAASGPDRARVLRHLNDCDECRQELEELSRVADEVLLITPEREPPAAFEKVVLDRISASAPKPRTARRWFARPALQLAAAAIFALAGAGIAWQSTADDRELAAGFRETLEVANGRYFVAAPLIDSGGAEVGHVFIYDGDPSWVFAVLGPEPAPGTYEVVVTTAGRSQPVATCEVETTGCGGGGTVDAGVTTIQDVRLVAADGSSYTADLPSRRSAE